MRQSRIVAAFIALFMGASLSLVGITATSATAGTDHSSVVEKAKKRSVSMNFKPFGAKSFQFTGKVSPKGSKKTVVLLRSTSKKGKFTTFKTSKTNGQGKYKFGNLKKEGYYVVRVNASNGYKTSFSKPQHICKGSCS